MVSKPYNQSDSQTMGYYDLFIVFYFTSVHLSILWLSVVRNVEHLNPNYYQQIFRLRKFLA